MNFRIDINVSWPRGLTIMHAEGLGRAERTRPTTVEGPKRYSGFVLSSPYLSIANNSTMVDPRSRSQA